MNTPMPENHCPECGAPLTPGSAQGLCARCLLAEAAAPTEHNAARSTPPTLEQVAAAFPQLEILELIGHGGMGAVFKVRQPKLARFAALKLLPQSLAADPAFASRFEREAQLLARLNHANIVAVYDHGQAGEFFYLLMEYVDGVNLRQAMRASRFTPAQALGIVPKICEALQYAHEEGVLHRDIKPENILLDAKGRVKLADFGIAKLIDDRTHESHEPHSFHEPHLTQAGAALGTPQYMAPEQRDNPGDVDHRADIYSLGVVFYELLTGELPIGKFAPPSKISAADPRVDAIVQQALAKDRERRQHSASEMKTQVETLGSAPGTSGVSTSSATAPTPTTDVRSMVTAPAIAMMIMSGLGILGTLFVGLFVGLFVVGGLTMAHSAITPVLPFHLGQIGVVSGSLIVVSALLGLAGSAFVFFAGWRMRTLRNRGLALAGSIVLIVTGLLVIASKTPMWSIAEIAIGVWALVILLRPEVSAAFASAPATPAPRSTDARSLVAVPAGGLMVASALNLLLLGVSLLFMLFFVSVSHSPTQDVVRVAGPGISVSQTTSPPMMMKGMSWMAFLVIGLVFTLIPSILTFIGAWRMRQLRGYGLAITAAILGIITPPGMIIGVIFGIWALAVLTRGEVRAAFENGTTRSGGRGCLIAGATFVGLLLVLALGFVGLKTVRYRSSVVTTSAVEVRYRAFEADAALVEKLVPEKTRLPGEMQDSELQTPKTRLVGSPLTVASQTAEVSADVLARLLPDASAKPGVLVDKDRSISTWPRVSDTWGYNGNDAFHGNLMGNGFVGVRSSQGGSQLRSEYRITYRNNTSQYVSAQIAWEGAAPQPGGARTFFLPFTTTDGKARFVVIAFEVRPTGAKMAALDKWIQGDWVFDTEYSREKMRFRNPNDATNPGAQATAKVMFDGYEKMSWTITPTEMQSHHSESGTQAGPYRIVKMLDPNAAEIEITDNGTTKRLVFRREGDRLLLSGSDPQPEATPIDLPSYYKRMVTPR